jgi:hypothetical protein
MKFQRASVIVRGYDVIKSYRTGWLSTRKKWVYEFILPLKHVSSLWTLVPNTMRHERTHGCEDVAPRILNLCASWRRVISFTFSLLWPWCTRRRYTLYRRLLQSRACFGLTGEEKCIFLSPAGNQTHFLGLRVRILVINPCLWIIDVDYVLIIAKWHKSVVQRSLT